MYLSSNIVCYLHNPICLTLLACLPLWVPQDLVPCHPWNPRTRSCKWRNLHRLKPKFSCHAKSSCCCPIHWIQVTWSGPVCAYGLSFPSLECNTLSDFLFTPYIMTNTSHLPADPPAAPPANNIDPNSIPDPSDTSWDLPARIPKMHCNNNIIAFLKNLPHTHKILLNEGIFKCNETQDIQWDLHIADLATYPDNISNNSF
jgi:hypothetical protein